jgi:hypothetical protein
MTVQTWEPIPPGHPGVLTRNAYQTALAQARRDCPGQFLRSRGKWLRACKGDQTIAGEAECWEWDGKRTSVTKAIEGARRMGADRLYIEGGIDASGTIDFADYEPLVAEWSVCVWEAPQPDAQEAAK